LDSLLTLLDATFECCRDCYLRRGYLRRAICAVCCSMNAQLSMPVIECR
jgi:hypothetical protein